MAVRVSTAVIATGLSDAVVDQLQAVGADGIEIPVGLNAGSEK